MKTIGSQNGSNSDTMRGRASIAWTAVLFPARQFVTQNAHFELCGGGSGVIRIVWEDVTLTRFRAFTCLWAILGVLLHASVVVRHNAMMVSAKLAHNDLIQSLSIICHSDGTITRLTTSEIPSIPEPSGNIGDCPICSGTLGGVAILPAPISSKPVLDVASIKVASVGERISVRLTQVCPPPRGPPLFV